MSELPYSQACENNKAPILEVLTRAFADRRCVLEIGSGTGQHACHFAPALAHLKWQPSETPDNLPVLLPRCDAAQISNRAEQLANLLPPLALDVCDQPWPAMEFDAVFSANTLHIMNFASVQSLFGALGRQPQKNLSLAIYGPFNYDGRYTSASNARFDQWLVQRDPESAIRNFEDVNQLATDAGFSLQEDVAMPANNRLLWWRREG